LQALIPRLTNYNVRISPGGEFSLLVVESLSPFKWNFFCPQPGLARLEVQALANMFLGPLEPEDGIIKRTEAFLQGEKVVFQIELEEPVEAVGEEHPGLPFRLVLKFPRYPLQRFYRDKIIVLDPGHGGGDGGWRGPVNLWERDMAWRTAMAFAKILENLGARVEWTRGPEENPPWEKRSAVTREAVCFLSLHYHGDNDPAVRGTRVLYNPRSPGNRELAQRVLERIIRKVKTPSREVAPDAELAGLGNLTALRLEPATITNWVEEGMLRNPYFHQKVALATLTAIKEHFKEGGVVG